MSSQYASYFVNVGAMVKYTYIKPIRKGKCQLHINTRITSFSYEECQSYITLESHQEIPYKKGNIVTSLHNATMLLHRLSHFFKGSSLD